MQNLTASIAYHAARHPQATAVIFDAQKISYADFLDRIERLSGLVARRRCEGPMASLPW